MPRAVVVEEVAENEIDLGDVSLINHVLLSNLDINYLVLLFEVTDEKLKHFHLFNRIEAGEIQNCVHVEEYQRIVQICFVVSRG